MIVNWTKVADKLPRDETPHLVFDGKHYSVAYWDEVCQRWFAQANGDRVRALSYDDELVTVEVMIYAALPDTDRVNAHYTPHRR